MAIRPTNRESQYSASSRNDVAGLTPRRWIRSSGSHPAMDHSLPNWMNSSRLSSTAPGLLKSRKASRSVGWWGRGMASKRDLAKKPASSPGGTAMNTRMLETL